MHKQSDTPSVTLCALHGAGGLGQGSREAAAAPERLFGRTKQRESGLVHRATRSESVWDHRQGGPSPDCGQAPPMHATHYATWLCSSVVIIVCSVVILEACTGISCASQMHTPSVTPSREQRCSQISNLIEWWSDMNIPGSHVRIA
jgi:hypothetical protein